LKKNIFIVAHFLFCLLLFSCKEQKKQNTLFEKLDPFYTHIKFSNDLSYDSKFNVYTYRNFYNGGGVAIGDINNDGLQDIFFTANMKENRLYLNKGNMQFEDITEKAGIHKKGKWSTGVSMADVNGDGFLDIYVCNSGDIKGDSRENELYINNGFSPSTSGEGRGKVTFTEKAQEYGLDDHGLSTHAAFFDYDHDGDLDRARDGVEPREKGGHAIHAPLPPFPGVRVAPGFPPGSIRPRAPAPRRRSAPEKRRRPARRSRGAIPTPRGRSRSRRERRAPTR